MAENTLELKGLTKTFGSVTSCDRIDLSLQKGEILALLGENGSGKTSLMNMIAGLYKPDEGEIRVNGEPVTIKSPSDAREHGIGMIHQHFKLVEVFTAFQNIMLGMRRELNRRHILDKVSALIETYGIKCELHKRIRDMTVGERQNVEIIKALCRGSNILILDEPTAVLTPQEASNLFGIMRRMKQSGASIIIITHKLAEVLEISDTVAVLRAGKNVGQIATRDATESILTEMMVGRKVSLAIERPTAKQTPLLAVSNLTVVEDGITKLDGVSFDVGSGEILGVAGITGSGQKQLCECIAGLATISSGSIRLKGQDIAGLSPRKIYDKGIRLGFIPEDRLGMGLVGSMDIPGNLLLRSYTRQKGFILRRGDAKRDAEELVRRLEVSPPNIARPVGMLSGGNLQKVLLGRELMGRPELLVTSYVVRGLDVNSSYKIYDLLNERKLAGVGALFVGEDLDVLIGLCDRIMVLFKGRVAGILDAAAATRERIGLLMAGGGA